MTLLRSALAVAALTLVIGCSSPRYDYRYVPGRTATLVGGIASAPPSAPEPVKVAIAAANRIVGMPYQYGGGHGSGPISGFDCSGTASFVLQAAGLLRSPMPSTGFRRYGEPGKGEWISIYARRGHVFLVLAGLRLDTGYAGGPEGPQWTTRSRPARGAVIRHPAGF